MTVEEQAEQFAELAMRRAVIQAQVLLGREPSSAEVMMVHLQNQVIVLTAHAAHTGLPVRDFWEKVTLVAATDTGLDGGVQ